MEEGDDDDDDDDDVNPCRLILSRSVYVTTFVPLSFPIHYSLIKLTYFDKL